MRAVRRRQHHSRPAGAVLASSSDTISALTCTATYTRWVYQDPNNTFCANCPDLKYQFTNQGPARTQRYSMSSFSGYMIDAGTNPFWVVTRTRFPASLLLGGDVISFNFDQFGNDIMPGETTVQLVIEMNATNFRQGVCQHRTARRVLHTATSALRDCSISVPANLFLNCQHKGFVIKGSIMTLSVDKKRRGAIDAATDATAEITADTGLVCVLFQRLS